MRPSGFKHSFFAITLAVQAQVAVLVSIAQESSAGIEQFETSIRPVLIQHCYECHSTDSKRVKGGLLLDSREGLLKGGDSGPAIDLAQPSKSLLLSALRQEAFEMPPNGKLATSIIESFERWLASGAPTPSSFQSSEAQPASHSAKEEAHWAFEPIRRPPLPEIENPDWALNPIDHFISAQLSRLQLRPSKAATDRVIARRSTFDTLGLPPSNSTFEDLKEFHPNNWYSHHIDRLLTNPHFGEHWGRKWLDLARYADTNGVDENYNYLHAWRYRDYVVRAFNQDKPYSRFLQEQIAGDLLPKSSSSTEQQDQITATGFLTLGPKMLAEQDKGKLLIDIVDEQIDVLSKTAMGLTIACARCHDHKFDPISARDYYALAGIFRSTKTMAHTNHVSFWTETILPDPDNATKEASHQAALSDIQAEIDALALTADSDEKAKETKALKSKLKKLKDKGPDLPRAMAVVEGTTRDLPVHIRGSHLNLAEDTVPRGFPKRLSAVMQTTPSPAEHSGRLELANWLIAPDHPLTARVIVNRIWQGYFGTGLVSTPSNFGLRGSPPTHPDLLDWLAAELIQEAWSLKHIHRLILTSATYRQASHHRSIPAKADPANTYLWRQNPKRIAVESIRDSILAVAARLRLEIGGIPEKANRNETYYRGNGEEFESLRRALYLPVIRGRGYELFNTFDYSESGTHLAKRTSTIVPHQALFMLNGSLVTESSELLAQKWIKPIRKPDAIVIDELYHHLLFRPPTAVEKQNAQRFLQSLETLSSPGSERSKIGLLIQSLLATNEFIYVE